ncbi:MAG: methyltransferase domain-containing protein [Candidatus Pacebacteria bacterium]|nr:methyltransferase domain-containing protein [Candidatus Paceibacterota bacterium]
MFLNPAKIIADLDLRPGMKVADFGCGSGHFTGEMARRVGRSGIVYTFDIQKEVLEALKSKLLVEGITNAQFSRVDLEKEKGTGLADSLVDFVLISNSLFQMEDKGAAIREAFRILRPGGKIAAVEWKLSVVGIGPPPSLRTGEEDLRALFSGAGFEFLKSFDAGDSHYGMAFIKPDTGVYKKVF